MRVLYEQVIHPGAKQIYGKAGTAIVFSNSNYHAGTARSTPHRRRV
eukprot:SAG11_NODE_27656_length_330_cov_1.116883_2_plen_45_part_01